MPLLNAISPNDPVSQQALKGLMETCPILEQAMFITKKDAAALIRRKREATDKTKITRSLNESNTATAPTPVYDTATKKIISFDAKVDVQLEDRLTPGELAGELAEQTYLEAREAGYVLQEMFFSGDNGTDSEDFDGMANLAQDDYIHTDGLVLPLGGDSAKQAQQEAMEKLLYHISIAKATDMYVPEAALWRLVTIAKNLGYYNEFQALGRTIPGILNTRLWGAGYDADGAEILGFTETVAGNANTARFYLVKWGEGSDLTAITTVGCKGRYAGQSGNFYINNINMDAVLHLQNHPSLVISKGWRLTES